METAAVVLLWFSTGIMNYDPQIERHMQTLFTLRSTLTYDFEQLLF